MTDPSIPMIAGPTSLDPLGDAEAADAQQIKRNRAKVGAGRPSSLIYSYGPGSVMDLPQFTIMPAGLDDWDRIWSRRPSVPKIHAPRLLEVVRTILGYQVAELRPYPWSPKRHVRATDGDDLGVPSRIFPQWLRCTGCDLLAPLPRFEYTNTHPYRTDEARFEHVGCPGRGGRPAAGKVKRVARPARYLLACTAGHLDEFPYDWWVHRGDLCAKAEFPALKMIERVGGKGSSATIECASCGLRRTMNEALGEAAEGKLPKCRGRHPHLDAFDPAGCPLPVKLMLVGASNLWFAATQSIVVMPATSGEAVTERVDALRSALGDKLAQFADNLAVVRALIEDKAPELDGIPDVELAKVIAAALAPPPSEEQRADALDRFDPVDLLVPEWKYLQQQPGGSHHDDPSGLTLSPRNRGLKLPSKISRVLAVDKLRKVNAVVGFTRIDEMERVEDLGARLAPLSRDRKPLWTVATEDRGEGIYLQLDETAVAEWEEKVLASALWKAHLESHRRNFANRFSETALVVDPDVRLPAPRYWLLHTLSHVLIREMAMQAGYSAASISERLYAWPGSKDRPAAAGLLLLTTASDSDGTLGGLVQLSEPARLESLVNTSLDRAHRCSSDPVCAYRTPKDPEDFLHGAACHCCAMASETSCERANRFLDRRFLVNLPGGGSLGFFG